MPDDLAAPFDELYRENHPKVYRLALSLAGNAHDAEDITQEAFFRAFRSLHTFRGDSSFSTWIYRIALNVANDHLKYRNKLAFQTLTEDLGYSPEEVIDTNPANDPEAELLAYQVRLKCLHVVTECLQPKERKVFCLAIILDLPQKHVAEILECSVGSVKTTLHRAKKRWFGYMENMCRYVKPSNPCNCKQYVRFALSKGVISKNVVDPRSTGFLLAKKEVLNLSTLRSFYQELHKEKADESFTRRLREGIRNKEWRIFSDIPVTFPPGAGLTDRQILKGGLFMETKECITLVAPCGINCGSCPMYKVKDDPSLREGLVKRINWNGVPCPGCRSAKGRHQLMEGTCATYACVSGRGHDFCFECKDFPCAKLNPASDRADVLPHNIKMFALSFIKQHGVEKYLEKEPEVKQRYYRGKMVVGKGPQLE